MLVDEVETYPDFLPWCLGTTIHERNRDYVEASLVLQKGALSHEFTTRNSRSEFDRLDIALIGGPFRHLDGGWSFMELGGQGSKVMLKLDFAFESRLVDLMFGSFFEETCNSLVDAFTRRAVEVYGKRKIK